MFVACLALCLSMALSLARDVNARLPHPLDEPPGP